MASSEASALVAFSAETGMAMSRRIFIEEPCSHGYTARHVRDDGINEKWCPGGSRLILDGIPEEWVEQAAREVENQMDNEIDWSENVDFVAVARAVLESVLDP